MGQSEKLGVLGVPPEYVTFKGALLPKGAAFARMAYTWTAARGVSMPDHALYSVVAAAGRKVASRRGAISEAGEKASLTVRGNRKVLAG